MNERMISRHDLIDVDGVWLLKAGSTYETSDCPTTHTPNGELGPQLIVVKNMFFLSKFFTIFVFKHFYHENL